MVVGQIYVKAFVSAPGPAGERVPLELLIDSGAQYSVLPHDVWQSLGLSPKRSLTLVLADGGHIERAVSECYIELPQGAGHTPVVLGAPGDMALLGMITLEELGFVFNPFDRSIRPMESVLLATVA
jgi:predicted aspartyl protease